MKSKILIIAIGIFISLGVLYSGYSPIALTPNDKVIAQCGADDDFICWKGRFQKITDLDGPAAAMADIKKAHELYPVVEADCHQLVHVIGRSAAKQFDDPASAFKNSDGFCSSGYHHGVMETITVQLGYDGVLTGADQICKPLELESAFDINHFNCLHGLGHGLMSLRSNNLFEALDSCNLIQGSWHKESCFGGVFMENTLTALIPGGPVKHLDPTRPMYPCTEVEDVYKNSCYLNQTSYALSTNGYSFSDTFELCRTMQDIKYQSTCYQSLGRDASGSTRSNAISTIQNCENGTDFFAKEHCYIGAAKDFVWYYYGDTEALAFCEMIGDTGLTSSCRQAALDYASIL